MKIPVVMALVAGLSVIVLAGMSGESIGAAETAAGQVVTFTAHDHGYTGPDRISAGMTTVEIVNQGRDLHHAQIVKLEGGKTAEEFLSAMKTDPARLPGWVRFVGGPNAILPGDRTRATMQLDAGSYLVLCLVPDKQGVLHVMLGMEKPLTVTAGMASPFDEPVADLTITERDFHFDLSQSITAGAHTVGVRNTGGQPHEVVVVKLAPGATAKDFVAAFEPGASGPPPGRPIGGLVGLDPGGHGFFTTTFEPGHYVLLCFFTDPATGRPHFAQGMTREFTIP